MEEQNNSSQVVVKTDFNTIFEYNFRYLKNEYYNNQ